MIQDNNQIPVTLHKILGEIGQPGAQCTESLPTESTILHPRMVEELNTSKYVTSVACQTDEEISEQESSSVVCKKRKGKCKQELPRNCRLNMVEALQDHQLKVGRGGYSQNLSLVQCKTNKS